MPDNFRQLDDQFEEFLDRVLIETKDSDLTEEKRALRRKKCEFDELAFCETYFPAIFDAPWSRLHRHIASLKLGKYSVSGFRKSGKTAVTYVGKIVHRIATRQTKLVNLSLRTLRKSQERTAALVRLILRNKTLCYDWDIAIQQDQKGYYLINDVLFIASSYETGLRSIISDDFKRIDLSINDDLYDFTTVRSKTDNEAVAKFIEGEIYGALEDHGLSITLGNRIAEECPIELIAKSNPASHFSFPALNEENESNWPEKFSREYWLEKERVTAPDIWDGDYMDRPPRNGDVFDPAWDSFINISVIKILASICAVDPSYGQTPSACLKAAATVGITEKQRVIVLDMYGRAEDYSLFFDYLDALRWRIPRFKAILFENDFNQWAFARPYYHDWIKRTRKTLPIAMHHSKDLKTERGADKDSRIMNLIHPLQTGQLLYDERLLGNRDFKTFLAQKAAYGAASKNKLDCLDALATAFIMIFRYLETGTFRPSKKRLFSREREQGGFFSKLKF